MTNALLSIIAGLIAVDFFFKHGVSENGESASISSLFSIAGLVMVVAVVVYGIAYLVG